MKVAIVEVIQIKKEYKCMNSNRSRFIKENSHQENIKVINVLHLKA